MGDAASGWDVRHDEASGQVYYWNAITGETSWEPPPHLAAAVPPPWTQAFDEDGRVYYLNAETMETRWTPPSTAPEGQGALATTGGRGRRPSTAEQMDELNRLLSGDVEDEPADGLIAGASASYSNVAALQISENTPTEGNTCAWMMFINESDGLPYYYNQATGECLWEPPEEFIRFHQEQAHPEESGEALEGSKDIQPPAASTEDSNGVPKDESSSARPKSGSTQVAITPEFEEKVRRAIAAVSNTPAGSSRIMLVRTPTEQHLGPRTGRSTRSAGGSARSGGAPSRPPSGGALGQPRPPSGGVSSRVLFQDPTPPQIQPEQVAPDGAKEEESSTEGATTNVQPAEQVVDALSNPDDAVAATAEREAQESALVTEQGEAVPEADEGVVLRVNGNEDQVETETAAELSEGNTELPGASDDATAEPVEQVVVTESTPEPDTASPIPDPVPAQVNAVDASVNVVPPALTADTAALIVQCMTRCFLARRRVRHQRERRYRVSMVDAVAVSPDSAVLASDPRLEPLPSNPEEDESRDETTSSSQSRTEDGGDESASRTALPIDPAEPEASLSVSLEEAPSSPPALSDSLPSATVIEPDAGPVSSPADSQPPSSGEPSPTTNGKPIDTTPVQPPRVYPTRLPSVLDISRYFPSKRSSAAPTRRESVSASAVSITRKKLEAHSPPRVRHLSQHEIEKMEARHQENLEARRREEERAQRAKIAECQQIYADARKAMELEKQRVLREILERDMQRENIAEVERQRREAARLEAKREREEERARDRVVGDAANPLLWELLKAPDRPTAQSVDRFRTALAQVLDAAQFADKMCAERARELQERIDQLHRASWAEDSHLESLELRLLSELHPLTDRQRPLQAKYAGKLRRRLDRMLDAIQAWQRVLDEWESGNGDVSTSCYWGEMHARYLLSSYSSDGDRRQCILNDWRGAAGGDSLLHVAAANGWVDHVRYLIEQGADVNLVDSTVSRRTPLHEACRAGRDQVVLLLLESGANLVALDCSGDSPLHMACRGGWNRVVRVLMAGAKSLEAKSSDRTDVEEPAASSFTSAFFFNLRNGKAARAIDVVRGSSLMGELEREFGAVHARV